MIRLSIRIACMAGFSSLMTLAPAVAQSLDTPMTRLRPIGAPSAVDRYRIDRNDSQYRETAYEQNASQQRNAFEQPGAVQQTVLLQQQMDAPQLPGAMPYPGNYNPPPISNAPANSMPVPNGATRSLPVNPGTANQGGLTPVPMNQTGQLPSGSDYAPIANPQLNDGFATIDNCNCISPPSSYIAASGCGGCAPVSYQAPQTYVAPPAVIAAPAVLPGAVAVPQAGNGVPAGALISFGQQAYPVQVGQGIFGQPVAYVPGQRIRNWIRYIFP